MFVLGDTVDFGPNPCGVLQLMHDLPYIVPILGDHEYKAIRALRRITEEIHTDNDSLSPVLLEDIHTWFQDGGATTFQAFQQLSYEERLNILQYLKSFSDYAQISVSGTDYVLVHAGLGNFSPTRSLADYMPYEYLIQTCPIDVPLYHNCCVITGHQPTCFIDPAYTGQIIRRKNRICIDCGAHLGLQLGAICLNTMEEFYA